MAHPLSPGRVCVFGGCECWGEIECMLKTRLQEFLCLRAITIHKRAQKMLADYNSVFFA